MKYFVLDLSFLDILGCLTILQEPTAFLSLNKEAIWLYAELFLGHHDGSCHGLWWFVVIHVMLCAGFCHG